METNSNAMEKSIFSKNLVKARKLKGWKQETAAKAIGIKRSVLGSYEEDRAFPPKESLHKICDAYDVQDLKSFINDANYFEIKIAPEKLHLLYSKLPFIKRKAIDFLLGIEN